MPKQHYWTPERDEELKRHRAAGLSASKIAARMGVTRNAVLGRSHRLREGHQTDLFGLPYQARPRTEWTPERIELIMSMWPRHSTVKIAMALGLKPGVVYLQAHKLGLRRRNSRTGASAPEHFAEMPDLFQQA